MNTVYTKKGLIVRAFIGNKESGWLLLDYNSKEVLKTFDTDEECFSYVYPSTIEYHRNPTLGEIRFGHGAIHYRSFSPIDCTHKNGDIKKWFIADDGLRYYR